MRRSYLLLVLFALFLSYQCGNVLAAAITEEMINNQKYEVPYYLIDCLCENNEPCSVEFEDGMFVSGNCGRYGVGLSVENIQIQDIDEDGLNDAVITVLYSICSRMDCIVYYMLGNNTDKTHLLKIFEFEFCTNTQIINNKLFVETTDSTEEKSYRFSMHNGVLRAEDIGK